QNRMYMQLVIARRSHKFIDDVEGFARTVYVMDQVADTVDDNQSDVLFLVKRPPDNVPTLVGSIFAEDEKFYPVVFLVCRQAGQGQYPVKDFVAMAFALFRVDIQDTVLAGRQLCLVFQYLFPRKGGRDDG